MIRSIASASVLGALVAVAGLWAATASPWRSSITAWLGIPDQTVEAKLPSDSWPICSSMGDMGTEADWAALDPDFATGKRALVAEDWNGAIAALELASLRDPGNADIQNYIGYAYRRLGQLGPAMGHFQKALMSDPRHRGAREHLGELFLTLGEPAKADEQLAALQGVCLIACDEVGELERAIAAYQAAVQRRKPAHAG